MDLCFFCDGFRITEDKSASGFAIYMICLNLPQHKRSGTAAVRIPSLVRPGIPFQDVLCVLQDDMQKGMTEGFEDYDGV